MNAWDTFVDFMVSLLITVVVYVVGGIILTALYLAFVEGGVAGKLLLISFFVIWGLIYLYVRKIE